MKYRENNTSNAGFLIMEVIVYLLIEIIFFGIVGYFVIFPIQEMFSILTERFIASEVVYKTRSASVHYGANNLNGIFSSHIIQGKVKFITNDIRYRIESNSNENLFWSSGKIVGRGGRIVNSEGKTIFNVVPVTGALTIP
ncbi:MAG: hypothetical protein WBH84_04125 [Defluviitoga tunisiensis]|uniref:Uncharacterized protein n=1 Tax=Defluviitoga tunisiensis TaxID=1006576 RepID=A0A0C7NJ66_DEFTU|nr:hypothetical protein [Defluviitoga tunisiensis]MDD3600266.1 hypothetical protein [Defluviitoga tunisiensis]MDY0379098.1 hypothetical protein [Defluviitoga tunisiensis]CEP77981.1 hypothetical protein DTL3_0671 [Defluviitoga tunisiensis]HHV00757.1 hypothetical protein [Defluviitoga tunisiensis]HOB54947.1 hypothetical protein [Defluviitoga tunisiensis]